MRQPHCLGRFLSLAGCTLSKFSLLVPLAAGSGARPSFDSAQSDSCCLGRLSASFQVATRCCRPSLPGKTDDSQAVVTALLSA